MGYDSFTEDLIKEVSELRRLLEASQAENKVLRDLLDDKQWEKDGDAGAHYGRVRDALSKPIDDTALRERLKEERDRCVTELLSRHENGNYKHDTRDDCIFVISALGDTE